MQVWASHHYRTRKHWLASKAAAREARAKLKAFMNSRLDNYEEQERFNDWFHSKGLVVVVDPRTQRTEILPAKIVENRIVEIWDSEWILPDLKGKDRDRYLEDTAKLSFTNM